MTRKPRRLNSKCQKLVASNPAASNGTNRLWRVISRPRAYVTATVSKPTKAEVRRRVKTLSPNRRIRPPAR